MACHVILDCQNFKLLVASGVGKANALRHTRFHQNQLTAAGLLQLTLVKSRLAFFKMNF